jgi:Cu(I)/Ag(I) efflux system membrane fusion protein
LSKKAYAMTPLDDDSKSVGSNPPIEDEGGLRAPPELHGWRKAWWWFDFIVLVKLARLRFIGILVVIGAVITQWDTIMAYRDRLLRPAMEATTDEAGVEYFCPMHPTIIRDNSKEKCPICFMPLSRRKKGSQSADPLPAGVVNRVQLTPYRVALAGVSVWPLQYEQLRKSIQAIGYVEFDERGQRTVSARVKGRIDKLLANETGQMVNEGDVLASLYSPELLVTVQNLIDARRTNNSDLASGARRRLELLGIGDDQIAALIASDQPTTHLEIRSPISGHIIRKYVREGDYVEEGSPLYDLADLSTVWIQAQVYEDDLAFLPAALVHGNLDNPEDRLQATATTRAFPNEPFRGTLAFVYPHVDQETRTVTVRFEVENQEHKLRPGSTATVQLDIPPQRLSSLTNAYAGDPTAREQLDAGLVLAVPESAVIDTGSQTIVYRESSPGVYEGVLVELAPSMAAPGGGDFFPVLSGLAVGDQLVAAGAFLVDAETRLNPAAGSIYFGGSGSSQSGASATQRMRPSTPEDPDAMLAAALAKLPDGDRTLAESQRFCAVRADSRLGSMGTPVKLMIQDQVVFLCCSGCRKAALADPKTTLRKAQSLRESASSAKSVPRAEPSEVITSDRESAEIEQALGVLSAEDRTLAELQGSCVVLDGSRLGSMGPPIKLVINGQAVFVCCDGCTTRALKESSATLARWRELSSLRPLPTATKEQ